MKQKKTVLGIISPGDFSNKFVSGGASGFLKNILPYLNNYRTIIFGIGLNDSIPWKTYHLDSNVDFIPICNIKVPSKIPMRLKVLIYYIRHRNRIIKSGVDVLYIQMPECCLPFLNKRYRIPVIYHKHGSVNPVSRSKYVYGRNILFKKFYEIVLMLIYQKATWIITIDRISLKEAKKYGAENRTSLLMNAVNTGKYFPDYVLRKQARSNAGMVENIFVILFVGRIEKTKGPERLLDCISRLKETKHPFHILLAGEGTYRTYLENKVRIQNYESNVTFLGNVPHEKMPYFYNLADVMVLPSETEGVPMVILEALACGTPVVASNVGSIPDLVLDGINGIVLDNLSPVKLASAIINILHKKNERNEIARSIDKHSAKNFIKSFNNIITNILIN